MSVRTASSLTGLACSRRTALPRARVCKPQSSALSQAQTSNVARKTVDTCSSLVASKDVGAGDVLLAFPDKTWLNLPRVRNSRIGTAVSGEAPWVQLALYLIAAPVLVDETWATFLEDFEKSGSKPAVLWEESDLVELKGTQVLATAMDYRSFFQAKFQSLQQTVIPNLPKDVSARCTYDSFVTAAAAVRARLFHPFTNEDPALVPAVDLIQHSRRPNVKLATRSAGFLSKERILEVAATRSLSSGEVLSIDFASDKLDSQVVLDYGVYDSQYPRPGYLLSLTLPEDDNCYYDKLDIVELQGMQATQTFTVELNQAASPEMLGFLRLMNIKGSDAFLMESIFRNEAWGHMCAPVSEENEEAICRSMISGCEQALAGFPTTLGADIRLRDAEDREPGCPADIALKLRMAEKQLLEGMLQWFSDRLNRLDRLEYYQERRLKRLGLLDEDGESTFEDMIKINM